MTEATVDVHEAANAVISVRVGTRSQTVLAAEGAPQAAAVVDAMRARLARGARIDDLAAAWRVGADAAGGAVLSVVVGHIADGVGTFIHAGDFGLYVVDAGAARRILTPHTHLSEEAPLRVRSRGLGLPHHASRPDLTEVRLHGASTLVIATIGVWASGGEAFLEAVRSGHSARELAELQAVAAPAVAQAVQRVPRAAAVIALRPTVEAAVPPPVAVAAQRTARRAIRAVLGRTTGARGVVLVGPRGIGKSTVLTQLGRAGMIDQSARACTVSQLRRELKSGALTGLVVVDSLLDTIGADGSADAAVCDVLGTRRVGIVTTATPEELAALAAQHKRLASLLAHVPLAPPTRDELVEIVTAWSKRFAERHQVTITREGLLAAVELTSRFTLSRAQPEAALFALEHACLRAGREGIVTGTLEGRGGGTVDRNAVSAAIADLQGVTIDLIDGDDDVRIRDLVPRLEARLYGQSTAVVQIASAVRRGIERRHRAFSAAKPIATCLLLGPTGTGKTEAARLIAECWYSDRHAITTLDLSEYGEPSSVFRLTGAPPGHVGFGEPSALAAALEANPDRVILFDELEKACSEVHLLLLQILDGARLTTSSGSVMDFSRAIVILTSNLDVATAHVGFRDGRAKDPDASRRRVLAERLRPELVARLDEVVEFKPLDRRAAVALGLAHFARATAALLATERLRPAELPSLRQQVLRDLDTLDLSGGARSVQRAVDRILANQRIAADRSSVVVIYPYLDGGRERLASGLVIEVADLAQAPAVIDQVLVHPSGGSLLYLVHDRARVLALVGDESAASEIAGSVGAFGPTRIATGRVRADLSGRPVGELLERLLER